jgi:hypothetical protein
MSEHSICTSLMGCTACARRIVSGPTPTGHMAPPVQKIFHRICRALIGETCLKLAQRDANHF